MKKNKRYLIIKKGEFHIREWTCLEVTETSYKILPIISKIHNGWSLICTSDKEEFWILKTDISTTGEATYKIIEELSLLT